MSELRIWYFVGWEKHLYSQYDISFDETCPSAFHFVILSSTAVKKFQKFEASTTHKIKHCLFCFPLADLSSVGAGFFNNTHAINEEVEEVLLIELIKQIIRFTLKWLYDT